MNKSIQIKDLMTGDVRTVPESQKVCDVAKMMTKHQIGAVVIVTPEGHPAGIFTERDLLTKVVGAGVSLETPVGQVMTANLICVQLRDRLDDLPEMMLARGFRHLPVMDDFRLVGILSIRDILRYLVGQRNGAAC